MRGWSPGRLTLDRLAAFGADGAGADQVAACRALAALDADAAADEAGRGKEQPENRGIEDRVDREAGPDWPDWQNHRPGCRGLQ